VEFIIPVSREMKNPRRNVPLAMCLALLVLLVIQSVLGSGMTNYTSTEELLSAEMPHIAYAEHLLGEGGRIWMSIVTLLAAISTMNTILPTVGKIVCGMSDEGMMPQVFRKTNRHDVPYIGMTFLVVCILLMLLTGYVYNSGLINMILAGSCFWLASYIMTHLNVLALRRRYPNAMRNRSLMLGGIPQIVGVLGCVYMIWNISSDMESRLMIYKLFGVLFAALALFAMIWCKSVLKAKPFKPIYIGKMNIDKTIETKSSL
jgi:amino acid transporter